MSTFLQVENYSNNLFMMAGVSNDNHYFLHQRKGGDADENAYKHK